MGGAMVAVVVLLLSGALQAMVKLTSTVLKIESNGLTSNSCMLDSTLIRGNEWGQDFIRPCPGKYAVSSEISDMGVAVGLVKF